jgi:UDP-2,3-diacylglucosamine pyrophosphatase LpxH
MKYKTIVISDTHVFANNSEFREYFQFLLDNPCDNIILLGDILDVFALMKKTSNFKRDKIIIKAFLSLVKEKKTNTTYIVGNHDYHFFLLKIIQPFLKIKIKKFYNFESHGSKIHATHGDWISGILKFKRFFNKSIVITGDKDNNYITYGLLKKCDILLCGHTHKPIVIHENMLLYINVGDWVDHKTAVVEDYDGCWNLITV